MDVTEAAERLSKASEREKKGDTGRTYNPIEVLGCLLVMTIGKINTAPAPTPPLSAFFPHSPTSSSPGGFKRGHSRQASLRTTFFSSLRLLCRSLHVQGFLLFSWIGFTINITAIKMEFQDNLNLNFHSQFHLDFHTQNVTYKWHKLLLPFFYSWYVTSLFQEFQLKSWRQKSKTRFSG